MARLRALLVGVAQYEDPDIRDLTFIADDLARLGTALGDNGYAVEPVADLAPSRNHLRRAVEQFVTDARRDDVLLVYLSGHGLHHGGKDYLVPADAFLDDRELAEACVPVDGWAQSLARTAAGTVVFLIDACREGITERVMGIESRRGWSRGHVQRMRDRRVAYVFACSAAQTAGFVDTEPDRFSLFARAVCDAVADARGPATLDDLRTDVQRRLDELCRRHHRPTRQQVTVRTEADPRDVVLFPAHLPPAPPAERAGPAGPGRVWSGARRFRAWSAARGSRVWSAVRRSPAWSAARRYRVALAGVLLVVGLSTAAEGHSAVAACPDPVEIRLHTSPDLVETFQQVARGYERGRRYADGCHRVGVLLHGAAPAAVQQAFGVWDRLDAQGATGAPDAADTTLLRAAGPRPDLWLADLTADIQAVRTGHGERVAGAPYTWSVAVSPVVLAVPQEAVTGPTSPRPLGASWGGLLAGASMPERMRRELSLRTDVGAVRPDPELSTVGRLVNARWYAALAPASTATLRERVEHPVEEAAGADGYAPRDSAGLLCQLRNRTAPAGASTAPLVALEWQVARYNRGSSIDRCAPARGPAPESRGLVSVYPSDTPYLDYPLAALRWRTGQGRKIQQESDQFVTWLRRGGADGTLLAEGLRPRSGRLGGILTTGNGIWRGWRMGALPNPGGEELARSATLYADAKVPVTVLVAVDFSGSMATVAGGRSRFDAALDGVTAALATTGGRDKVGLLLFSSAWAGGTTVVAPLGTDSTATAAAAARARGLDPAGRTPLFAAINRGAAILAAPAYARDRQRVLVVLTDGRNTVTAPEPRPGDGLRVLVVDVGGTGCADPVLDRLTRSSGDCVTAGADGVRAAVRAELSRLWGGA